MRKGNRYEADQRHAEIIIRELGLSGGSKGRCVPCVREEKSNREDAGEVLGREEASIYRGLVARGLYLTQDRTDIGYTIKELSRRMSSPREGDMGRLKRLGRYLVGKERVVVRYGYQSWDREVDVWTDSDYAGCRETRWSTSGG